ncbi:MAG: hypothetical protein WA840_18285 [Caulobacteraceae bacterium]
MSWLPALYVAMNASANLTLVKARIQFGIPAVTLTLLTLYAVADLAQLIYPNFATAVVAVVVNGIMAGALTSLSTYYLIQVLTPKTRPLALVIAMGLTQFGLPLARMVPVEFLAAGEWRGLHLLDLLVAVVLIAATLAVPLPPSELRKTFSRLDFVTISLMVPGFVLGCGVLGLGRVVWWTDAPFLGWMLLGAIPLLAAGCLIELHRSNPLLQLRWFGSLDIVRFAAVAALVRLALVEQTYGSVGLLTAGGLTNDQLRLLFACVALSMAAGLGTAVVTLSQARLPFQVMAAALIIAAGAYLDSNATSLTRPPELFLSQCLLGFGATLFIGPAMVYGFLQMRERGPGFFVTFVVLFGTTQNVGSLAGSALLGSYQNIEAHAHSLTVGDHVVAANPIVVSRIGSGASALAGAITDPTLRVQESGKLLGQALGEQSAVLAFNDVFRLVSILGVLTAGYVLYLLTFSKVLAWIPLLRRRVS